MKKILLLILGFILAAQGVTYAEINKNMVHTNMYCIESYYRDTLKINENNNYLIQLYVQKYNNIKGINVIIFATPENKEQNNDYTSFVFSVKNPPYMQIISQDTKKDLPLFRKVTGVNKEYTDGSIDRKSVTEALLGDTVYVVFMTKEGKEVRVEIPETILKEWQYVITADMRKIKKKIMGD